MDKINKILKANDKKYRLLFLAIANRIVGCQESAKDIVQEAYINVFENLKGNKPNNFKAYNGLYDDEDLKKFTITCVRRRAFDYIRNSPPKRESLSVELENVAIEAHTSNYDNFLPKLIEEVSLTETEKLILFEISNGKKVREIAGSLALTPKEVTNGKYYLLKKFRKAVLKSSNKK